MKKTLISMALALVMICGCITPAMAAEIDKAGTTGTTPVVLTVAPAVFSVTVPTELPVTMTDTGAIEVADSAKIINNSAGAVVVDNVEITAANNWELIGFDTDPATLRIDDQKIGLMLNGSKTNSEGEYVFVADDWDVMAAKDGVDGGPDEFIFTYDAILPLQTSVMDGVQVASVVFTIDWNK